MTSRCTADVATREYFPHLWLAEGLKYMFVAVLYGTLADPYMEMGGIAGAMERASTKKKAVRDIYASPVSTMCVCVIRGPSGSW